MTLKEAIAHAELIKSLRCRMCGETMHVSNNKLDMIAAIMQCDELCPTCRTINSFYASYGRLPDAKELWR